MVPAVIASSLQISLTFASLARSSALIASSSAPWTSLSLMTYEDWASVKGDIDVVVVVVLEVYEVSDLGRLQTRVDRGSVGRW